MTARELSPTAICLLAELRRLVVTGQRSRLTDAALAERCGLPIRSIIDAADELLQAGYLVLAACGSPPGRWLGTPAEARAYDRSLGIRAKKILIRRRHLRDALRFAGQLPLRFSRDPGPGP